MVPYLLDFLRKTDLHPETLCLLTYMILRICGVSLLMALVKCAVLVEYCAKYSTDRYCLGGRRCEWKKCQYSLKKCCEISSLIGSSNLSIREDAYSMCHVQDDFDVKYVICIDCIVVTTCHDQTFFSYGQSIHILRRIACT